jgi:gliding motility-associated-like protein
MVQPFTPLRQLTFRVLRVGLILCGMAWLLLAPQKAEATHIAGAELYYKCLGGNNYELKLVFYRDCLNANPGAVYDNPLYLYVFNSDSGTVNQIIPYTSFTSQTLALAGVAACISVLPNICLQRAEYVITVNLPPRPGGYDIGWQRCCRNGIIKNMVLPLDVGMTWLAHIPTSASIVCNSNPTFNNVLPYFLCAGEELTFDHSATDIDGDSLVYSIVTPYDGVNLANPAQGTGGAGASLPASLGPSPPLTIANPMGPPPYRLSIFPPGFSTANPVDTLPGSFCKLDSVTGQLRLKPQSIGTFVLAIGVKEYRNGVLLSESRRDIQLTVVVCNNFGSPPVITRQFGNLPVRGDTVFLDANVNACFSFLVQDPDPTHPVTTQVSSQLLQQGGTLSLSGSAPQTATVCWTPGCNLAGQLIRLDIRAQDDLDCPNYNFAFDTIYVRVKPLNRTAPVLTVFTPGLTLNNDTVVGIQVDSLVCFEYLLESKPASLGTPIEAFLPTTGTDAPTRTILATTDSSVRVRICWRPTCNSFGTLGKFEFGATAPTNCPPGPRVVDALWIKPSLPPDPPPSVLFDPNGLLRSGDTLLIKMDSSLCVPFSFADPNATLNPNPPTVTAQLVTLANTPVFGAGATVQITSTANNLVQGFVCAPGTCQNLDLPLRLRIQVRQASKCRADILRADSVIVRIYKPYNPPPRLSHTLPAGATIEGDTLVLAPDSSFCYTFTYRDSLPVGRRVFATQIVHVGFPPTAPPLYSILSSSDTLTTGRICFTGRCSQIGRPLAIVLRADDSISCILANRVYDTVWVRVRSLFNPAPTIVHSYPPPTRTKGDTVLVYADSSFCFLSQVQDSPPVSRINTFFIGAFLSSATQLNLPPATRTELARSPLSITTRWCWTAPCAYFDSTLLLVVSVTDSSACTPGDFVYDTIPVRIQRRPLAPLRFSWTSPTLPQINDTVIYSVKQRGCISLSLNDSVNSGLLQLRGLTPPAVPDASLSNSYIAPDDTIGAVVLNTQWCWRPACNALGRILPLVFEGQSQPPCADTTLRVRDTVWLRITEPINNPPVLTRDVGSQIQANPGDSVCYTITATDPDAFTLLAASGSSPSFQSTFGAGSPATIDTIGTNPLQIRVCIQPNCYQQEERFFIKVCVLDTSTCTVFYTVCDSVELTVDICKLQIGNVFTPNRDGVNDYFGPYDAQGIQRYTLTVLDRWGKVVYPSTANGRWDGTSDGSSVSDGVYFYRIDYQLYSGRSTQLSGTRTGSVTVLR